MAHAAFTMLHASPDTEPEKVLPVAHAAHFRSVVTEPEMDIPWPTAHVLHLTHAVKPALAAKEPAGHATQTRSLATVGPATEYVPGEHTGLTLMHAEPDTLLEYVLPTLQASH